MSEELHLYLDIAVVIAALAAIAVAFRMRHLFNQGTASRPVKILAYSPSLMVVGEASHVVSEVWGIPALDPVHDLLEAAFFLTITAAAWLFVRAWSIAGSPPLGQESRTATSEAEILASIINQAAADVSRITGPVFGQAVLRQSVEKILSSIADDSSRNAVLRRLIPAIAPGAPSGLSAPVGRVEEQAES